MALFKRKSKAEQPNKPAKSSKPKKVTAKVAAQDFVKAAKEFEQSRIGDIERSRIIAWRIAIGSCAVAMVCAIALMLLTPLKEVRPYVIRVDNNTGQTDIVTMLDTSASSYQEEIAKFFSAQYVRLVEGYDWFTIQNQIDQAMMFSDRNMQNRINTRFAQPNAPHKIYRDQQRVNIRITNTTIIDERGLVQVRFVKSVEPMNGGVYNAQTDTISPEPIISNHLATLGYEYVNVPTLDAVRLVNPLGFTVKTYRVDDIVGED